MKNNEPCLWTIDSTGMLWHVNTRNCTALPCVKLQELPSSAQRSVLERVWGTWTKPIISCRFCRANIVDRRGIIEKKNKQRTLRRVKPFFNRNSETLSGECLLAYLPLKRNVGLLINNR